MTVLSNNRPLGFGETPWGVLFGDDSPAWWEGVNGGAQGYGGEVSVNGRTYRLPDSVLFPPNGWGVWSNGEAEQWLINVGSTPVGHNPLSEADREELIDDPGASQVRTWQQEQERLNANASNGPLDELRRIAKLGGVAGTEALKQLAAAGDTFAKIALAFGIGYATVSIALAAGGGLLLLFYLKK